MIERLIRWMLTADVRYVILTLLLLGIIMSIAVDLVEDVSRAWHNGKQG